MVLVLSVFLFKTITFEYGGSRNAAVNHFASIKTNAYEGHLQQEEAFEIPESWSSASYEDQLQSSGPF